ncbi:MAG: hypothetical protein WDW38_008994 [Sanguina aurantia]
MSSLATAIAILLACASTASAAENCAKIFGGNSVTVLMVADPGSFSGNAEGKHFLASLTNKRNISSFAGTACAKAGLYAGMYSGKIAGQPVVLVTSGIGPTTAALCTVRLLTCSHVIKEFIYQGTSGWSAAVGGIVNPPSSDNPNGTCTTSNPNTAKGLTTRLGDICVSPYSLNWACALAEWGPQCAGYPNQCYAPVDYLGPTADFLYGKCVFTSAIASDLALTNELVAATKTPTWTPPLRNAYVHATHDVQYWNTTNQGSGRSYHMYNITDNPTVYDYHTCSEVDAQFFWSGAPWDYTGRQYTAILLNQAMNVTTYNPTNVIAVSAMEAIGFTQAIDDFHAAGNKHIPYTYVRGNSDYTHEPLKYDGMGSWSPAVPVNANYGPGYEYAIATYSSVTMTMLKLRCMKQVAAKKNGIKAADCTFNVTYA